MGKVLFVVHDIYQDDNIFPLGIGYLAAAVRRSGYDADVYCMDVYHHTNDELADYLAAGNYDLVGLGFLAARFRETVMELCQVINENKKKAWLVLGGHGPSPIPEYILQKTGADVIAIGEAEQTIVELLECKLSNGLLEKVKSIAYLENGQYCATERRKPVTVLDSIPFPAWELFPVNKYSESVIMPGMKKQDRFFPVLSSRGCIGRCNFCYQVEKGFRMRSAANIFDEIEILYYKYGINYIFFADDLSIASKKNFHSFVEEYRKRKLELMFFFEVRADIFDEEIADGLREINCTFINFGFESASQAVLDYMGKNIKVEQNYRAAELALAKGFDLGVNFIWGQPNDDAHTLQASVEFIKKYNTCAQIRTIRPVTAFPGTALYYEAIRKGLLEGVDDFFQRFINSDRISANFTGLPEGECYDLLLKANSELIRDHYAKVQGHTADADALIDQFRKLYSGESTGFRGARKYDRKKDRLSFQSTHSGME